MVKTLYVLVDVVVSTMLSMRSSDGAVVGGFGNGVIVVLICKKTVKMKGFLKANRD